LLSVAVIALLAGISVAFAAGEVSTTVSETTPSTRSPTGSHRGQPEPLSRSKIPVMKLTVVVRIVDTDRPLKEAGSHLPYETYRSVTSSGISPNTLAHPLHLFIGRIRGIFLEARINRGRSTPKDSTPQS
jgi:hypothetical protein